MTLKFAAHLDTVLQDLPVSERITKFAELRYTGFEFWCWWDDKYDIDEIAQVARDNKIEVVATCTKFVSLVDESCREEYMVGLKETIRACKRLNIKIIISQVGDELVDVQRDKQKQTLIEGLKEAAKVLEGTGLTLAVEPLNLLVDHTGYFLSRSDEAAEIINAVDSESVRMLFDIYHQHITEGDVIDNVRKYSSIIAHYHIADHPGRHEPGTGEIDFSNVLAAVEDTGYAGYIGLEFFPRGEHMQVLKDLQVTLS